ncbi:MAG TPA: hypothetical protein VHB51_02490 [Candidatus Saccharimonadales bacterium]|nr:hypothetical protein [Candidatus Saccharimonadales bacterium]
MSYGVDDPRRLLSRRVQDFHESDPAIQAALAGEERFPITAGHLVSTALETGYFKDVDDCLDYFELDRTRLADPEPLGYEEIDHLENLVASDVEGWVRPEAEKPYIAWAAAVVEALTVPEEDREAVIERLLSSGAAVDPESEEHEGFADRFENRHSEFDFHTGKLQLQLLRAVRLVLHDGFAITATTAMKSLQANGFIPEEEELPYGWGDVGRHLQDGLAYAAYNGMRREVEDGLIDPTTTENPDGTPTTFGNQIDDFCFAVLENDPVILSAKDLWMFAHFYASPRKLEAIKQDPKYIALVGLFKNTEERIEEVQAFVRGLRK